MSINSDLAGFNNSPFAGSRVVQSVFFSSNSSTATTSSSYVNTAIVASITPVSSNNKILVLVDYNLNLSTDNSVIAGVALLRGSNTVYTCNSAFIIGIGTALSLVTPGSFSYIDSPATTSNTTYTFQARRSSYSGTYGGTVTVPYNFGTMTLVEFAS